MDETEIIVQKVLKTVSNDILKLVRSKNLLRELIKRIVIDECIRDIDIPNGILKNTINDFYRQKQLDNTNTLNKYLVNNGLTERDLQHQISIPIKVEIYSIKNFEEKAEAHFLQRKEDLDEFIYSVLRVGDSDLAYEFYLQIEAGESQLSKIASEHSLGKEKLSGGIIGPSSLANAHPLLKKSIRTAEPGILQEPIQIENWWVITRLEERRLAAYNSYMKKIMCIELFDLFIDKKCNRIIENLQII